jgi:hypothetical protein
MTEPDVGAGGSAEGWDGVCISAVCGGVPECDRVSDGGGDRAERDSGGLGEGGSVSVGLSEGATVEALPVNNP